MKVDFYDLYIALCRDIEISPSEAAKLMGFNKSTVSLWKNKHTTPTDKILIKMERFFNVPYSFLTQSPPYNCWKEILEDYSGFLKATELSEQVLLESWGIDPQKLRVKELVKFINDYIAEIRYENGVWTIISKTDANNRTSRDIRHILKVLQKSLENNDIYSYGNTQMTNTARQRLIWAIQLGPGAADGIIKDEKKPS